MAKFCTKCGARMEDGDRVCGQCGTPVEFIGIENAAGGNVSVGDLGSSRKTKGTKGVKWIVFIVVAIIGFVIVSNVLDNYTGYKGAVRKMVKALEKGDIETLESLTSSVAQEEQSYRDEEDYDENYYEDYVFGTLDKYEEKVGDIKKISYEITDELELSERQQDIIEEKLIDNFNMDTSSIKKIVTVDLRLTVRGEEKSSIYDVQQLYLIKESGGWKIYRGNFGS